MKSTIKILILLFSISSFAQIGINTTTPNAMLDVSSTTNGVLISRIALTANNVAAPVVNPQGGAVAVSTLIYNTATVAGVNGVAPGFYYWSGTLWISLTSPVLNDWKLLGNTAITTPVSPLIYGTTTIGVNENFVGSKDANDVVIGTNNRERLRVKQSTGNVGIGTATPNFTLDVQNNQLGATTSRFENTAVGNSNGIGLEGKATNNPGFGIGGQFTGNATGVKGLNTGSAGATTYGGDFTSTGVASTGTRYGVQGTADGGSLNTGGSFIGFGATAAENYGGFLTAFGGAKNVGSQSQATGPANSLNGGVFGTATGGNNSTNYAGNFNAQTASAIGTTNYAGFFAASGGNKNYAIVVPGAGGIVGFGTITPRAMLDVESATNGVLLPRIILTANNVAAPVVNPQGGALTISTIIYNTATVAGVNGVSPGYYYWNGSLWIPLTPTVSNDWKLNGNTAITTPTTPVTYGTSTLGATENFIGTTDANDVVVGTNNIERFRIKQTTGNVGIGTANPTTKLDILSPGNTLGLRLLSGNNAQYSYLSLGRTTDYASIGACTNGTFFTDALDGDMAIKNFNSGKILLGASFIAPAAMSIIPGGNVGIGTANPGNTLEVLNNQLGAVTSRFQNTSLGNSSGTAVLGVSANNPGYGTGGAFIGGLEGVTGQVNFSTSTGTTIGVRGRSTGTGDVFTASRVGGDFFADGGNFENYGGKFLATNALTNYGASFRANGIGNSKNYGGNFEVFGATIGNWGGVFNSTGGATATGADFFANNGTVQTTAGYFQAIGATTNYGTRAIVSNGAINYGGSFVTNGTATSTNYSGFFISNGGTNNHAGYFSATGGTNNYAIVVPSNGGNVGIGTLTPVDQLEVAGGFVRSTGYRCRTGNSGVYGGNTFNINWSGASAQLWIDVTNVGTFQFTSDRRLKENIIKINDNALSRVMQLKPVSFNYKNIPNTIFTGSDVVTEGFIADELQQIIPSAVNGDKNALTSEGTIQPQTLNMPPVVSVLTKAIQEQQAIIEELLTKNNQLEQRLKAIEDKLSK